MPKLNIIQKPIDQSWSIFKIATEMKPSTWEDVFDDAIEELRDVSDLIAEYELTNTVYPNKCDIFAAFNNTPLNTVKVVIVGQDPYHQSISIDGVNMPRAVGLSFSVRKEDGIPVSLQNIYTELCNTVSGFKSPDHGDLREWAKQGVLLLNMCLTVFPGKAGSHGDIWLGFINKVLKAIKAVNPHCIFLLWGQQAQKIRGLTQFSENSVVLEAAHPSGFSARRGFFGCNHFNKCNDALIMQEKKPIRWNITSRYESNIEVNLSKVVRTVVPINVSELINLPIKQQTIRSENNPINPINLAELPDLPPLPTLDNMDDAVKVAPVIPIIAFTKLNSDKDNKPNNDNLSKLPVITPIV